jgi:FkbM family methyltransferase
MPWRIAMSNSVPLARSPMIVREADRRHLESVLHKDEEVLMLARLRVLIQMEKALWRTPGVPFKVRFLYALSRVTTLPSSGYVSWFGGRLYSDNRLGLLLMPGYLQECRSILQAVSPLVVGRDGPLIVLDIGANVGQFASTLLALDSSAQVLSVEPNPVVLPILRRNLKAFVGRSFILTRAVGPEMKQSDFFFVVGKSAQGSMYAENAVKNLVGDPTAQRVPIEEGPITSEQLVQIGWSPSQIIDLVKLDVEGYEMTALAGLSTIVFQFLWVEVIPDRHGGFSVDEFIETLQSSTSRTATVVAGHGDNVLLELRA